MTPRHVPSPSDPTGRFGPPQHDNARDRRQPPPDATAISPVVGRDPYAGTPHPQQHQAPAGQTYGHPHPGGHPRDTGHDEPRTQAYPGGPLPHEHSTPRTQTFPGVTAPGFDDRHPAPGHPRTEVVPAALALQAQPRTGQPAAGEEKPEKEKEEEKKSGSGLSIPQVMGGACAAVSAALVSSKLGVAGTLIGAAVASVVSSVCASYFTNAMASFRDLFLKGKKGKDPDKTRALASGPAGADGIAATKRQMLGNDGNGSFVEGRAKGTANFKMTRSVWLGSGLILAVTIGVITVIEFGLGHPVSSGNREGTSISNVLHPVPAKVVETPAPVPKAPVPTAPPVTPSKTGVPTTSSTGKPTASGSSQPTASGSNRPTVTGSNQPTAGQPTAGRPGPTRAPGAPGAPAAPGQPGQPGGGLPPLDAPR
ncbi:hypothetical protein SAMN05421595_0466 [Austwickia chelonae]|uniref:Uncharacterized protein n=1 Tax=Austwickia chelonae NBRC 105200 TaxID=1184607 RepID=K6VRG9_9MICO|nr:hypothetical protein [Austwickia chelonae]GAB77955.1 hypothetical protein AUCHE_08_01980 [Austwickia chelonae NBRC 105200]SEV93000.1 hypothetical protein SAMN05421595_0466 [Austwickia chelonae]